VCWCAAVYGVIKNNNNNNNNNTNNQPGNYNLSIFYYLSLGLNYICCDDAFACILCAII